MRRFRHAGKLKLYWLTYLIAFRVQPLLEAADGSAALRIVEARPEIRFMFTDVGLPGDYNGKELADEVR